MWTVSAATKAELMALIVQKYGGSSVATTDRIKAVADRVARTVRKGHQVVVVVSAMGKSTNQLIDMARDITDNPPAREYDLLVSTGEKVSIALLSMALNEIEVKAKAMSASHLGIVTDGNHRKARVQTVEPEKILRELEAGHVVVAAGFQGQTAEGHITTLGRGASDKTAVMLAAALKADKCEINTDVDGVYTSDPRVVPEARKLKSISCDEMLELATSGARVMNSDAIEWAKKYGVTLEVRHSFHEVEGTMVQNFSGMDDPVVIGAACTTSDARITLHSIGAEGGGVDRVFRALSDAKVNIDMILLTPAISGMELSFTVPGDNLKQALALVESLAVELEVSEISHDASVAKVSIVGVGMQNHEGVAARMFESLFREGIVPGAVTTSEIKISVLVPAERADDALRTVHSEFDLSAESQTALLG